VRLLQAPAPKGPGLFDCHDIPERISQICSPADVLGSLLSGCNWGWIVLRLAEILAGLLIAPLLAAPAAANTIATFNILDAISGFTTFDGSFEIELTTQKIEQVSLTVKGIEGVYPGIIYSGTSADGNESTYTFICAGLCRAFPASAGIQRISVRSSTAPTPPIPATLPRLATTFGVSTIRA
jgi:hypothetical protein